MGISSYTPENLLAALEQRCPPVHAGPLRAGWRRVEHGLLSVGLKLHLVQDHPRLLSFFEELGGTHYVGIDHGHGYRHENAKVCIVLPAIGNARTAILLLRCLEEATQTKILHNKDIQIQVCSPGRLVSHYAALLSIAFYLASDVVRRVTPAHIKTTFSYRKDNFKGVRLVISDGGGKLDTDYEWWAYCEKGHYIVTPTLPFKQERTDILTAHCPVDIENVNLVATLLCHAQHRGRWWAFGEVFAEEMTTLLRQHLLEHLLEAPWIRTNEQKSFNDAAAMEALNELCAYTFSECQRIALARKRAWEGAREILQPTGILVEIRALLKKYRAILVNESNKATQGESP